MPPQIPEMQMPDIKMQVALLSAGTTILTLILAGVAKFFWERYFHVFRLTVEHKHDQRKRLKELLSRNKIQLLNAAEALNHRLWNFHENYSRKWMHVDQHVYTGVFPNYFGSFIYRFATFFAWIRIIEKEMIYIDGTFAQSEDLDFIKYLRTLPLLFCDVSLFDGFDYDRDFATDHFFRNNFELMVDSFILPDGVLPYEQFRKSPGKFRRNIKDLLHYFDGISPEEERYRWDVLKLFHLLLVSFLNNFGYDFQKTDKAKILHLIRSPRRARLEQNFLNVLDRNKLKASNDITKHLGAALRLTSG